MKRKSKIPTEEKIKYVKRYLAGKLGKSQAAKECGVSPQSF